MSDSALLSNKESENEKWTSTRPASSRPLVQHSVRIQVTVVLLFFAFFSLFLFLLEWKLTEDRRKLEFDYKEFYLRPFHYKLDPFSYVELRNGVPITEPEPPNPYFSLSFEELLLNRFVDYLFWTRGPTDEADVTVAQDRLPLTIQAFAGHLRNRIYYRKEHGDLTDLDPLLVNSTEQPNTELEGMFGFINSKKIQLKCFMLKRRWKVVIPVRKSTSWCGPRSPTARILCWKRLFMSLATSTASCLFVVITRITGNLTITLFKCNSN